MPVKVKCSGCSTVLKAPDRARGKAIKCPKCGKGVRIPAGSAARAKQRVSRPAVDEDDFLGGMDLGHVEDRSARVCPKCGAQVGEEDVDCPLCGADLMTGGLGTIQRARSKRKGAAPSEYYSNAAKDAGSYLVKKMSLIWKSSLILTIFPILALLCQDMFVWCHNGPPKAFWVFCGTVCGLFFPGWFWYVQNQFNLRILESKRERYPVRMETFSAVSLGIKAICWSLFFGLPFWVIFGGMAGLLAVMGSGVGAAIVMLIGAVVFGLIILISWPVVQAHFTMPITWPGWMIHKVLPDVARNLGPSLYAAAIAFGTFLPVAGIIAGAWLMTAPKHAELRASLAENSRINGAADAIATAEENSEEPPEWATQIEQKEGPEIPWKNLLWPLAGQIPVAIALSFWMVYNERMSAYFLKLFRANIGELIAHEKEYTYQKLNPLEQEKLEEERGPLTSNSVKSFSLLGVVFAALGGVGLAFTIGKEAGFLLSFAAAFGVVGSLLNSVASLLVLVKAFRTSPVWGLALLVPIVNGIAFFVFIAKESKRTVYDFQLWLVSMGFGALAGIFAAISIAMSVGAAAKEADQAEGAEQALRMVELAARFMC